MKRIILATVAAAALIGGSPALAQDAALQASIKADYDANLGALWDHFHRNPELSGLEVRTAARMADELTALGYEVTTDVGGTGVVAVLMNGDGPTVMIRADMDGLPVIEQSGLPNASTARQVDFDGEEKPVMHACGHDVHITALIGTARQMMARRDRWSGTLVLIAQPAEEGVASTGVEPGRTFGARAMVEDGLYDRFPKPDYALAFHVSAGVPAGRIEVPLTVASSSADSVDIIVHGVGAHGAYPQTGVDPVLVAAQIVVSLQSIVSRNLSPLDAGVITVGAINGGNRHNIIPDRAHMKLTVRADSHETRQMLLDNIRRVALGTAAALGVPDNLAPEVIVAEADVTPPTLNDPATAQRIRDAIAAGMGPDALIDLPRDGMGAEDFSWFVMPGNGVKGVYFSVGGTADHEVDAVASHHSPFFRIEAEPSIRRGVEASVVAAEALMPRR